MFRNTRFFSLAASVAIIFSGCSDGTIPTPLEEAESDILTSHEEMLGFFDRLQDKTEAFSIETVGTSVQGRDIVLLRFAEQEAAVEDDRLKVLIFAQQHGNEHSGMQASIALARDIATGAFTEFQRSVDLYLIPQVNPDGSELRQRYNANGNDLNRDHLTLSTPEVQAVHRVFGTVMPHVVLDVHEYGIASRAWVEFGVYKDFGQQIDGGTNPNIAEDLRAYAIDEVVANMKDELVSRNVTLNRYLVTDGPQARFRHSTAALNDGRNSTGIYNALTFLIEGRNGLTVEDNIRERTRQQMETMKAFLNFFGERAQEVKEMVETHQAELAGPNPPEDVALVMDYVRDPENPSTTFGVVDTASGQIRELVSEEYYPVVETSVSVKRPAGYLIPANQTRFLEVLERHGVEMTVLETTMTARGEGYLIGSVEETEKEDKPFLDVRVAVMIGEISSEPGQVFVPASGIQSNLIVSLLEPQSQWGLAQLPEYRHLLAPGAPWPVRRVLEVLN
jgi:hypothetical protein